MSKRLIWYIHSHILPFNVMQPMPSPYKKPKAFHAHTFQILKKFHALLFRNKSPCHHSAKSKKKGMPFEIRICLLFFITKKIGTFLTNSSRVSSKYYPPPYFFASCCFSDFLLLETEDTIIHTSSAVLVLKW